MVAESEDRTVIPSYPIGQFIISLLRCKLNSFPSRLEAGEEMFFLIAVFSSISPFQQPVLCPGASHNFPPQIAR